MRAKPITTILLSAPRGGSATNTLPEWCTLSLEDILPFAPSSDRSELEFSVYDNAAASRIGYEKGTEP